jgi:hypothetical protein
MAVHPLLVSRDFVKAVVVVRQTASNKFKVQSLKFKVGKPNCRSGLTAKYFFGFTGFDSV